MSHFASQEMLGVYETLKVYHDTGTGIPAEELPRLLRFVKTAAELALDTEEELKIATRIACRKLGVAQDPVTIEHVGNVVRLPPQSRPRAVPSDGGDAA